MEYRIITRATSDWGRETTTVAVGEKIVTIKDSKGAQGSDLTLLIFQELIRLEPSTAKRQDLARQRYAFERSVA